MVNVSLLCLFWAESFVCTGLSSDRLCACVVGLMGGLVGWWVGGYMRALTQENLSIMLLDFGSRLCHVTSCGARREQKEWICSMTFFSAYLAHMELVNVQRAPGRGAEAVRAAQTQVVQTDLFHYTHTPVSVSKWTAIAFVRLDF